MELLYEGNPAFNTSYTLTKPQMQQVSRERAIGTLQAVVVNVHFFSIITFLRSRLRQFGTSANRTHAHRGFVTTAVQEWNIHLLRQCDCLRPATRTAGEVF